MNNVTLSGNLVAAAEEKETTTGKKMATVRIAVNHAKREAEFFSITAFDHAATALLERASKGSPVVVSGRLRQRSWEDADSGEKRYAVDVVANQVFVSMRAPRSEEPAEETTDEPSASEPMPVDEEVVAF